MTRYVCSHNPKHEITAPGAIRKECPVLIHGVQCPGEVLEVGKKVVVTNLCATCGVIAIERHDGLKAHMKNITAARRPACSECGIHKADLTVPSHLLERSSA